MLYMLHVRSFYECSTNYKYEKSQEQNIVLTELKTLVRVLNIHAVIFCSLLNISAGFRPMRAALMDCVLNFF